MRYRRPRFLEVRKCLLHPEFFRAQTSGQGVMLGVPNADIFYSPSLGEAMSAELPCLGKHPDSAQGHYFSKRVQGLFSFNSFGLCFCTAEHFMC